MPASLKTSKGQTTIPKEIRKHLHLEPGDRMMAMKCQTIGHGKRGGVRKNIFFSSGGTVYGVPQKIPIAEDHPTDPISSCGIQKVTIEKYLRLYHDLHGLVPLGRPQGRAETFPAGNHRYRYRISNSHRAFSLGLGR